MSYNRDSSTGHGTSWAGQTQLSSSTAADDQLDAYVADLILAEAKKTQSTYEAQLASSGDRGHGLRRTYFDPSAAAGGGPKPTNKRFLSNIIRDVDAHNRTVIRQQQKAANEASALRRRRERGEPSNDEASSKRLRLRQDERVDAQAVHDDRSPAEPSRRRRSRGEGSLEQQRTRQSSSRLDDVLPPSKMDKYFDPAYDPALDIDVSRLEDGATGLIGELPELLLRPSVGGASSSSADKTNWDMEQGTVKPRDAGKAQRKAERAERRARKAARAAERERRRRGDTGSRDEKTSVMASCSERAQDKRRARSASTDSFSESSTERGESRRDSRRRRHSRSPDRLEGGRRHGDHHTRDDGGDSGLSPRRHRADRKRSHSPPVAEREMDKGREKRRRSQESPEATSRKGAMSRRS